MNPILFNCITYNKKPNNFSKIEILFYSLKFLHWKYIMKINVGGSSKGHLVRELDALGGEMGKNIDKTFIQSKMLNVSKGPAVHSLRAQGYIKQQLYIHKFRL